MVNSPHEASHRIFQDRPELVTPIFRVLGVPLAAKVSVDVLTGDVTEIRPLERRVDSVLRVEPSDGGAFLLAIEAQGRRDPDKAASWTYYLAYLAAKYGIPALLLVICQDRATARWATGPFRTGVEGWTALTTHPLVIGPDSLPVITSPTEAARNLDLATFSALTHAKDPDPTAILEALASALGTADSAALQYYTEMLEIGLGNTPARDTWRTLMRLDPNAPGTYFPGRGTLIEETFLKAKAESILRLLAVRDIPVPESARERITGCTDDDTLNRWFDRAVTTTSTDELFTEAEAATAE
ncbi:hypothetical protein AB0A77_21835 [Streptomyces varsoviensis]|uniref:hypothetical protein n=1 Tax=Streptomyces varsoviensis TaxID=67373 RepID=UPI0033E8201E